ncbi:hypothetical protein ABUE29_25955 [Mesorhizobium sp. ZMM04-4]
MNEQIGRRLFEEPMLRGAAGQPNFSGLRLNHFEETRGNEVSLDRLGATGIDRKVSTYLRHRADLAGQTFSKVKQFDGWAVVPAKELAEARKDPKLPVTSSPISGVEPNDNAYHAHVLRPNTLSPYLMALHLKHIFTSYGKVHSVETAEATRLDRLLNMPIVQGLLNVFRRYL